MYRKIAPLFLLCLPLLSQVVSVHPDDSDKEGILDIVFLTSAGDLLPSTSGRGILEPTLTVEELKDGAVSASWNGKPHMNLKYGMYRLKAHYPATYPVEKLVEIRNPYQAASICFTIAPIELGLEGNLIRGRISEKSRENDCRLVRFLSPFRDGPTAETKAGKSGYFSIDNLSPGEYLVVTIGKTGICEAAGMGIRLGQRLLDLEFPWAPLNLGEARQSYPLKK